MGVRGDPDAALGRYQSVRGEVSQLSESLSRRMSELEIAAENTSIDAAGLREEVRASRVPPPLPCA